MSNVEDAKAARALRAERAAQLRQEQADREAADKDAEEEFQLQELELVARFAKSHGRQGVDWAMVSDARFRLAVVVKLGSDLAFRKYIDAVNASEGGVDATELYNFVAPCVVHPSQEEYADIARTRGFIANRCAEALSALHGTRQKTQNAKF